MEIRYREPDDDTNQVDAIIDACAELVDEGDGDILVFLSGEREIHDTADAIRQRQLRNTEVLPLYARLSSAEQHRIWQPHRGRRIVLATNVAETSITVPGVRYVVDAGTARISRYSRRLKVQRLPIEEVSKASADQRAGRCGRVAAGVCIRLYSEENFQDRPDFTEPEILRTNLASVILQMANIGLGDLPRFPFVEAPDSRSIRDGELLLEELHAISTTGRQDGVRLTKTGRQLARLPIDPRLGRMLLEADRRNCVREVLVIVAALSIQDVRERPADKRERADEFHNRFKVKGSDLLSIVKLWDYVRERQRELSGNRFRRMCRDEFIHYLRVREWVDLHRQLKRVAADMGIRSGTDEGHPDHVHQALLAGLLSHVGMQRPSDAHVQGRTPGRVRDRPRLGADPQAHRLGHGGRTRRDEPDLRSTGCRDRPALGRAGRGPPRQAFVRRAAMGPQGRSRRRHRTGDAVRVAAGLRPPDRSGPRRSRRRSGLVHHQGVRRARRRGALAQASRLQRAQRRSARSPGLDEPRGHRGADVIDDETLFQFFDERIGDDVTSTQRFDQWWKEQPSDLLDLPEPAEFGVDGFPDVWRQGDIELPLTYRDAPGEPLDGVTVHLPLNGLNQITADGFDWQVPGHRDELVEQLLRSLPKALRRALIPFADTVDRVLEQLGPPEGRLVDRLATVVTDVAGVRIAPEAFDASALDDHLRMHFVVSDDRGEVHDVGQDLTAIRARLAGSARQSIADAAPIAERRGITSWDVGDLPQVVETDDRDLDVRAHPTLLDVGDSVSLRVVTSPELQRRAMRGGVRRLLLLDGAPTHASIERLITNAGRLAIEQADIGVDDLVDDCIAAAVDQLMDEHGTLPWTEAEFRTLQTVVRAKAANRAGTALGQAVGVVAAAAQVNALLGRLRAPAFAESVHDANQHLGRLVRPGMVSAHGIDRLDDVERYVRGIRYRLEHLGGAVERDRVRMGEVLPLEARSRSSSTGCRRRTSLPTPPRCAGCSRSSVSRSSPSRSGRTVR